MNIIFSSVRAVMTRRILVNYRVRPDALPPLLPSPFRPKLIDGWGLAGICLIRLEHMRPAFLPSALGVSSENAAHRIAVEWTEGETTREGVFIPRRDTDSLLNRLAGGRLFPGVHQAARFKSREANGRFEVDLRSRDGRTKVHVAAHVSESWPKGSLFASLEDASAFFQGGCCGWSPGTNGRDLEGVELRTDQWTMQPLAVDEVESSFFADRARFEPGSMEFDSALLMRDIPHSWHALDSHGGSDRRRHHGSSALFELP